MTTTINTFSQGTNVRFDPTDDGVVLRDAMLVSTDSNAVLVNNGGDLTVYGLVYGNNYGVLVDTMTGSDIFIAGTGRVTGNVDGIHIGKDGANAAASSLVNNGEITGLNDDGVSAEGNNFSLVNNGTITGNYGVYFSDFTANNVEITNNGTISGYGLGTFGVRLWFSSSGFLTNNGTISNSVVLIGAASGAVLVNTGTITGNSDGEGISASFSTLGDVIRNSGSITGNVTTGGGTDSLFNTGSILGNVDLGGDADNYRADLGGIVSGQVSGGAGADDLTGNAADDRFDGGADDDTINTRGGDDTVTGGAGSDEVDLGSGRDVFLAGNNEAQASDGNDDIDGGDGIDTYDARGIATRVSVNLEELRAAGAAIGVDHVVNFENIRGGSGSDILVGDDGRNVIRGGGDIDFMLGNDGNDRMIGNSGNDSIRGGAGRDVSTGGDGIDTFIYNSISEAGNTTSSRDIITDFVSGTDKINLSVIDANSNAGGNQAFSFIGAGGFTGVAGQLHTVGSATHLVTVVEGDIDGDAKADFQIALFGNLTLAAGDFIL